MTRTRVGTRCSLTRLTFVTRKTFTYTSTTGTQTLSRTFRILVKTTLTVWIIYPGKIIRAYTIRTVTRVMRQTKTPIIEAFTNAIFTTSSVAGTLVVAGGMHRCNKQRRNENLHHNESLNNHLTS